MVFSKYYDRALLLMLLGDKTNNEMIINFLKFMPLEMHKYIRDSISLNSHIAMYNHSKTVNFEDMQVLGKDGCVYRLECSIMNGVLNIKLNRYFVDIYVMEQLELSLQPLRLYDLNKNINIGSFSYIVNDKYSLGDQMNRVIYSKKYDFIKLPLDNLMIVSDSLYPVKIVSVNSCLKDISLEMLFSDSRFNKYSKKKILNNKRKGY